MDTLSFEQAFEQLEAAVEALQDGQMPLEQALNYYEEGMKLAKHCNELLEKADRALRMIGLSGDADELKACHRLRARIPDAQIWMVRVGSRYVHRFGGREQRSRS